MLEKTYFIKMGSKRKACSKEMAAASKIVRFATKYKSYKKASRVSRRLPELKEFSTTFSSSIPAAGGTVLCLNQVPQGTDIGNRIGRHLSPQNCDFNFLVLPGTGAAAGPAFMDAMYIALVWDRQPDGLLALYNNVFDTSSATPALAFKDTAAYRERFTIIWEERVSVQQQTGTLVPNFSPNYGRKFCDLSKRFKDTEYYGAVTSIPSTGGLLLCYASYSNTGAASSASLSANIKFQYTDL